MVDDAGGERIGGVCHAKTGIECLGFFLREVRPEMKQPQP